MQLSTGGARRSSSCRRARCDRPHYRRVNTVIVSGHRNQSQANYIPKVSAAPTVMPTAAPPAPSAAYKLVGPVASEATTPTAHAFFWKIAICQIVTFVVLAVHKQPTDRGGFI